MTLEDLFRLLSYGELSNLATAVEVTGTIKKEHQNRIVAFANEGLKRLHLRLPLIEEREMLALSTTVDLDHTLPTGTLLVTSLITPYGESLTINTNKVPDTIYVVGGILHVPKAFGGLITEVEATYRKRHPELRPVYGNSASDGDTATPDGVAQEITLLPELHEALTAYIAQKVFGGMVSQDAQITAQQLRARYEQIISEVQNQGLLPGELEPMQKLEARGFV